VVERGSGGGASLSLWEICEGNLEGELSCWELEGMVEKALETGIHFQRGPAGEPGRGLIYRVHREMYERGFSNGASVSERLTAEGSFTGDPGL